ncbi:MAG TPA: amino acid ABC transporter permease [Anaerolineales bacterium]|nr:amino acid ABC transporter permease [Anaerolineales bacterium]
MAETLTQQQDSYLPPPAPPGAIKWIRDNLFKGWLNTLLTLISAVGLYFAISRSLIWFFAQADWTPIINFPILFSVGQYPREELWRIGGVLSALALLLGFSWSHWGGLLRGVSLYAGAMFLVLGALPVSHPALTPSMRVFLISLPATILLAFWIGRWRFVSKRMVMALWLVYPFFSLLLIRGLAGSAVLELVSTTLWGGLLVTFVLSIGGIVICFPIGVALALGRRSKLPVVSAISTFFIETIRGVPLITLLFLFSVVLALFLPPDARLDRLLRALIAMTIFSAAYMAENVRGGLQAIPPGQEEAAKALGMNGVQITALIVLPQALRIVIPTIVGQFITLFKDTTLVYIVGVNDFLGIGRSIVNSNPAYLQAQLEVYLFIAAIYWIFSYLMSLASRRLETSLGVGKR